MRRVLLLLFVLALAFGLCVRIPAQISIGVTPGWLTYLGNGSAGAFSCKSGFCGIDDEHWYTSFNVSAGATALVHAGNGPGIIRSTGACTITGTLANTPNLDNSLGISVQGDFGGGGGGGGGGSNAAGHFGWYTVGDGWVPIVSGGTKGAAPAGSGGNGATPALSQYASLLSVGSFWPAGGSVGGKGGGPFGGVPGNAGGPVIMVCQSINFTGTINVSGGAGLPPTGNNSGGGGGGGAGYVILSTADWVTNTGTINLAGGAGGGCGSFTNCGPGGNGGNGWSIEITISN
jgi:hypothetical protein